MTTYLTITYSVQSTHQMNQLGDELRHLVFDKTRGSGSEIHMMYLQGKCELKFSVNRNDVLKLVNAVMSRGSGFTIKIDD